MFRRSWLTVVWLTAGKLPLPVFPTKQYCYRTKPGIQGTGHAAGLVPGVAVEMGRERCRIPRGGGLFGIRLFSPVIVCGRYQPLHAMPTCACIRTVPHHPAWRRSFFLLKRLLKKTGNL
jgi:hypothetical protein